jgi:hypothetical protein
MSSKAKTIARRLLRQNRGTRSITPRSWRVIAREDYQNKIPHGTLCRFALEDGAWLPKDEYQYVLGLKRERKATHAQHKDLFDMATDTLRNALINREPMPPLDPRIVKQFIKLGWMKRERVGAR